jgi:hypothetical protein
VRRLFAVLALLAAIGAVVGAVALFSTGFVGPAPILLAGAGGLLAASAALWRPPRPSRAYPRIPPGTADSTKRREDPRP